jgi:hypothetical protein
LSDSMRNRHFIAKHLAHRKSAVGHSAIGAQHSLLVLAV